jgi:arginase
MTTVLCVPQWQGSGSIKARLLGDGARRAAELISCDARVTVAVLDDEGTFDMGVRALDVLLTNLDLIQQAYAEITDVVVTVGGDCGVELAPITEARVRYGDNLTLLWFDAHPDVNTPQTLRSGSFHGMVLRTLLGEGPAPLVPRSALSSEQVILAGVRAYEPGEREYIQSAGIQHYGVEDLERVLDGLTGPVYVHIDLDVLEPSEFGSVCYPEANGTPSQRLIDVVSQVDNIVGVGITEHAPSSTRVDAREMDILRRLGAVVRYVTATKASGPPP